MSAPPFSLDPRLEADTVPVGHFPLCALRWMRDARYPWALLVPARPGITEIHQLSSEERRALVEESSLVAQALERLVAAHKMNVAAIGNVVPQLHVHVVARFREDDAWPRPVWGLHPPLPYRDDVLRDRVRALRSALATYPEGHFVPAID